MNRSELIFSAILVPLDYIVIVLAGVAAYAVRFSAVMKELRAVTYELPQEEYLKIILVVGVLWVAVFALSGLYRIKTTRRRTEETTKIILACSAAVMVLILIIFYQRELFSSRFIIIIGWVFSIVFITVERSIVSWLQKSLLKRGVGTHAICVIGSGTTTDNIISAINNNPGIGYQIVRHISNITEESFLELEKILASSRIDEIIQTDARIPKLDVLKLIDVANEHQVTFKYTPDLLESKVTNISVSPLAGIPIIEIRRTKLEGWGKIVKRLFDLAGSMLGLITIFPLFLLAAIYIKLDSRGPVFARLGRVGRRGEKFILFKFRSMVVGAHAMKKDLMQYNERNDGPLFKMKNDPRITRAGRFLRKTSIDELPQLFNVLAGNMSLVGPRPHEPEEVERYKKHHHKLLNIKPGMTGMAQVSGRSDLSFEEEVKLDVTYIENWSFGLDLQILFKTPFVLLIKKGAV